ncbi:MAG: rhomboid family intramembrane serine protease [bacterium]
MFPVRDLNPTEQVPLITYVFIAINLLVFGYQLGLPREVLKQFIHVWGFVPVDFTQSPGSGEITTAFTSMFLHGGPIHLAGNMLFLWVFGDNIEDELGPVNFLVFYLLCGIAAVAGQYWAAPYSEIPMVGASGAISGVMGAYLLLYPSTRILTIVIIIYLVRFIYLPAWFFLGYWFLLQFLSGTISMYSDQSAQGGVAWFAHIGGFAAGIFLMLLWKSIEKLTHR